MIDAIGDLIEAGPREGLRRRQLRLRQLVPRTTSSLEERAQAHGRYEDWIVNQVVPFDPRGLRATHEIAVTGVSFGAYHAANFALRRADLFPLAICQSGVYDVSVVGGGERGDAVYFNNPADYVAHLGGDHLDWLRGRVSLAAVVGQGAVGGHDRRAREHEALRRPARPRRGSAHELDVWGHDVPHDWPAWRAQIAHHLPRFV